MGKKQPENAREPVSFSFSAPRFNKVIKEKSWAEASDSQKAEFAEEMAFHGYNEDVVLTKWNEFIKK